MEIVDRDKAAGHGCTGGGDGATGTRQEKSSAGFHFRRGRFRRGGGGMPVWFLLVGEFDIR
jgi:hypothetical protein